MAPTPDAPNILPIQLARAIMPDMFGINGDLLFTILVLIVLVVLAGLVVRYATKAMQLRVMLEKELKTTRSLEHKVQAQQAEFDRLKSMESTYKLFQTTTMSQYASPSYGQEESTQGNYGQIEVYQHYEQIPEAADERAGGEGASAPKAAVATVMPMRPQSVDKRDFIIQDVFVIYKDGRLITHLSKKVRIIDDSEIIGSMITAVQTFVRESFRREARGTLEEMKFGDVKIMMEYGTHLNIALVIRGAGYEGVRPAVKELLIILHQAWSRELSKDKWDGNLANIAALEKVIQKDLLDRFSQETLHRSEGKYLDLSKAKVFHPSE